MQRVLRTPPRRPCIFVSRTRRSARSRAVQGKVRRSLVHRSRRCTYHTQRSRIQHHHRHRCRTGLRILRTGRQQVLVRRCLVYLIRHIEGRRRNVRRTQLQRVFRIALGRPDVCVFGARWSTRCRAVQREVRRALVHRSRRCTYHVQCSRIQHRHRYLRRTGLCILCACRQKVLVRRCLVYLIRHVEGRRRNVHGTQLIRVRRTPPGRPDVFVGGARWRTRSRAVQGKVRRSLVHRRRIRTYHAQRSRIQHCHRYLRRTGLCILRAGRKQVFVRRRSGHLIRHGECRSGTARTADEKIRVRRRAPRCPDVCVRGTRGSTRSHAVQSEVRRALIHRRRRCARNIQRLLVQHRHGNVRRSVLRIVGAYRHRVFVVRVRIYIVRHIERRFQDRRAAQQTRARPPAPSRPRVRSARRLVRHRTVQSNIGRALVYLAICAGERRIRRIRVTHRHCHRCSAIISIVLHNRYRVRVGRILIYIVRHVERGGSRIVIRQAVGWRPGPCIVRKTRRTYSETGKIEVHIPLVHRGRIIASNGNFTVFNNHPPVPGSIVGIRSRYRGPEFVRLVLVHRPMWRNGENGVSHVTGLQKINGRRWRVAERAPPKHVGRIMPRSTLRRLSTIPGISLNAITLPYNSIT